MSPESLAGTLTALGTPGLRSLRTKKALKVVRGKTHPTVCELFEFLFGLDFWCVSMLSSWCRFLLLEVISYRYRCIVPLVLSSVLACSCSLGTCEEMDDLSRSSFGVGLSLQLWLFPKAQCRFGVIALESPCSSA